MEGVTHHKAHVAVEFVTRTVFIQVGGIELGDVESEPLPIGVFEFGGGFGPGRHGSGGVPVAIGEHQSEAIDRCRRPSREWVERKL